jgi:alkanesulfonate monooxygenase
MPVEIIGMVGTRDASEIKGPLVDGPVVDWTDGSVIEPGYLESISQAHDNAGFDRVLVGYGAVAPEGWAVASTVLNSTKNLKVLVAHRPQSTLLPEATKPTNTVKVTSFPTTLGTGALAKRCQ